MTGGSAFDKGDLKLVLGSETLKLNCFCGKKGTFTIEFDGVTRYYCRKHGLQKSREVHKIIYSGFLRGTNAIREVLEKEISS